MIRSQEGEHRERATRRSSCSSAHLAHQALVSCKAREIRPTNACLPIATGFCNRLVLSTELNKPIAGVNPFTILLEFSRLSLLSNVPRNLLHKVRSLTRPMLCRLPHGLSARVGSSAACSNQFAEPQQHHRR